MKNLVTRTRLTDDLLEENVEQDPIVRCVLSPSPFNKCLFAVTSGLKLIRIDVPDHHADGSVGQPEVKELRGLSWGPDDDLPAEGAQPVTVLLSEDDPDLLHLALDTGDLITVHWSKDEASLVGSFGDGALKDFRCSPDGQLVAAVTSDQVILLSGSPDFDVLAQLPLEHDQSSQEGPVSVGWGSKATQFHGKAGKAAAQFVAAPKKPPNPLFDDGSVHVEWTEDSQQFVVSLIQSVSRIIRFYDREGTLVTVSDSEGTYDGIDPPLSWKPNGQMLATGIRAPNKHMIGFFEKNGLRHGEFKLPFDKDQVRLDRVLWNADGSILSLVCQDLKAVNQFYLQLWTVSNYSWHLKQSWTLDSRIVFLDWDVVNSHHLTFVTAKGELNRLTLGTPVHHSHGKSAEDLNNVAVVNGNVLKVTPFRQQVVPPPISSYELHFKSNVRNLAFSSDDSNKLLVQIADGKLYACSPNGDKDSAQLTGAGGQGFAVKCSTIQPEFEYVCDTEIAGENLCWLSTAVVLSSAGCWLMIHSLEGGKATLKTKHALEASIACISGHLNGKFAYLQLSNGSVFVYDSDQDCLQVHLESKSPKSCVKMEVVVKDSMVALLMLSGKNRLYLDGQEILNGVTSFFVHSDFLLVTTIQHQLKTLPLETLFTPTEALWTTESVRALERGSKLVCADAKGTKVILQMPRGNLEVIHPRSLTLKIVKDLLKKFNFAESLEILRRQRINQNIVVDNDPQSFLENIETFVQQVTDIHRLSLFIADLT